jgi:hypothetical protein
MGTCVDLTGRVFDSLTVIEKAGYNKHGQIQWKCRCECGNEKVITGGSLTRRRSKSCGQCPNPNRVEHLADGSTVITLERRNGDTYECFIDTADYPLVQPYHWHVIVPRGGGLYAANSQKIFIHQLLLGGLKDADHRDRNGLNNRRSNLRPATRQQQQANHKKHRDGITSRYRGVSLHKTSKKFRAAIVFNDKQKHLGLFVNEEDAARAFNKAATEYFGEFASLNDVPNTVLESEFAPASQPPHFPTAQEISVAL